MKFCNCRHILNIYSQVLLISFNPWPTNSSYPAGNDDIGKMQAIYTITNIG